MEFMEFMESELMKNVWIATVSHDNGKNIYASETEKGAVNQVYDYVKENWNNVGGSMDCPEDQDYAIEEYFDFLSGEEDYAIEEVEVKQVFCKNS